MKDKQTEKTIGRRTFLKTMGVTAFVGASAFAQPISHALARPAGARQPDKFADRKAPVSCRESGTEPKKLKKSPFYSHIPKNQIQLYQSYLDRAFELSPTLEFEQGDPGLHGLLAKTANNHFFSEIDFEMMRLQYVSSDKREREKYRSNWAEKVVNQKGADFFPDPWAIVSAMFAEAALGA